MNQLHLTISYFSKFGLINKKLGFKNDKIHHQAEFIADYKQLAWLYCF